jgi:glycosyltransferase involved in cell wall biosynthesis
MRIAFIITGLSTGGAEIMLLKLLQHLDRKRFEPHVISLTNLGEVGPRIEALGIPVLALGMRRGVPNPFKVLILARRLRQLQPDLVSTWLYHADLLGGLAARLAGCRMVVWGLRNSDLSRAFSSRKTFMVAKVCAWTSHWLPKRILTCSSCARAVHIGLGYQADKIHVIPNGFDLTAFQPSESARHIVRAELSLAHDTPLVGLIARYDPQKNHAGFIVAAAHVHALRPDVHFVLAGTAVDADNLALRTAISAHGLQAHLHLLGRRDDVPRLMAALDVLASPSFGEAFPNVVGEAMACGVPCVVTDVGDCSDIVGDTGRVAHVGDMLGFATEVLNLLRLPNVEKAKLGRRARTRVQENYEIGRVTELYQAFYERMAAQDRLESF